MSIRKLVSKHVNVDSNTYVGKNGEIFLDLDQNQLRFANGVTGGGVPLTPTPEDNTPGSANTGDITFNGSVISTLSDATIIIETVPEDMQSATRLVLDPNYVIAKLEASTYRTEYFGSGSWNTATWTLSQNGRGLLSFTEAYEVISFLTSRAFSDGEDKTFIFNGNQPVSLQEHSYSQDGNLSIDLGPGFVPPQESVDVTQIEFKWQDTAKVSIDYDDYQELQVYGKHLPVMIKSDDRVQVETDRIRLYASESETSNVRLYSSDYVRIRTGNHSSADRSFSWEFQADGAVQLPNESSITEGESDNLVTLEFMPGSTEVSSQKLVIKAGQVDDYHLHLTTGDLTQTSLYLGSDHQFFKVDSLSGGLSAKALPDASIVFSTSDDSDIPLKYYLEFKHDGMLNINGFPFCPVAAPMTSAGQSGDKQGMVAFGSAYLYYCSADYSSQEVSIAWTSVALVNNGEKYVQATVINPDLLNDQMWVTNIVSAGQTTTQPVTGYEQVSGSIYKFYLESAQEPWNTLPNSELVSRERIWKRIPWEQSAW